MVRQDVRVTHRPAQSVDLEAAPSSVGVARRFVRQVLLGWELDGLVDTVALLTSELATNAVLHARTQFAVLLEQDGDDVRVEVLDGSAVLPRRRSNSHCRSPISGAMALRKKHGIASGMTPPIAGRARPVFADRHGTNRPKASRNSASSAARNRPAKPSQRFRSCMRMALAPMVLHSG